MGIATRAAGKVIAMLALLGATAAFAQDLKPWRHGVIEPKGDAGFSLMVGERDFAARHGLKLDIVHFKNGAIAHKALLAGEVDSIESSPGAAILAGARGADIKIVGCDWPGVPHGLMTRADIASVKDLKGKSIAVAQPGSLPNLLIGALLDKFQMTAGDVRFANLGGDLERYKALTAGVVDAGVIAAEFLAVAPPGFKMLVAGRDVLPNYVRLCLTMTGKTLAARADDTARFLAAEMEALRFALANRDATIAVTRRVIDAKPDDPRPAFVFDDTVRHTAVDPDITLPADKLAWMQDELVKAGNLSKPADLSRLIDARPRSAALALLKR
jgi:NitT/TauT family transport system substrate-binding protein